MGVALLLHVAFVDNLSVLPCGSAVGVESSCSYNVDGHLALQDICQTGKFLLLGHKN